MDYTIQNYNIPLDWMNETIEQLDKMNWLYKVCCFITCRRKKKWTYKELYIVLIELNRKTVGEDECRKIALNRILTIYKFNNNKLPKNIVIRNGNDE